MCSPSPDDIGTDEITPERVQAGVALYSRFFLSIYDWLALGFGCRFFWRCRCDRLLELYDSNVSANHLDIGVGTGYFLDHCRFPSASPRLALLDLNPNSLQVSAKRLARYNPEVYQNSALESFDVRAPGFDSAGMVHLLHCLPGNMNAKAVVFQNVKSVLNTGGIVFGSTILGRGPKHNPLANLTLKVNNRKGVMSNLTDDLDGLRGNLRRHFSESDVQLIGSEALFWARN